MSYLGQVELKSSEIRRIDVTGSTSATHTLTWTPASEQSLIITINGIKQQNNYSISGTTLTLDTALVTTDEMEVIGILDIGEAVVPPDDSITTAMVKDDAIDADKLANSINTEITANTAKVTNATHTGDVTGATALTIASGAVDLAMLSATGTADATTFLRGDNAWAGGGKILQVLTVEKQDTFTTSSVTFVDITDLTLTITPSAATSRIYITGVLNVGQHAGTHYAWTRLLRDSTVICTPTGEGSRATTLTGQGNPQDHTIITGAISFVDSPNTTSATVYKLALRSQTAGQSQYINRTYTDNNDSSFPRSASSLTVMEIGA